MDMLEKYAFELTIGAMGYLARKWYGEELEKYIFNPLKKWSRAHVLDPLSGHFRRKLITTQREAAIWLHYKNRAHRKGHKHKNPMLCNDERCRLI